MSRSSMILIAIMLIAGSFLGVLTASVVSAAGVSPIVNATSSGSAVLVTGTTTTYQMTMPSSHRNGDLILVIMAGIAGATQPVFTFQGDFHTLYNNWQTGSRVFVAGWFQDDGAKGANIQFVTTIANTHRYIIYAIDKNSWYWGSPPEIGTAATGTSTTPDPPAVTPSWGSDEDLFIATGTWASTATRSACPTNYATPTDVTGTSPGVSACLRTLTGTTDNPGTFTISASSVWTAQTIVVRGGADISARFTTALSGLTATFTSTVSGAIGAVTYAWTFGDGATSTSASPAHAYAAGGEYNVALTVQDTLAFYTAWGTVIIGYPSLIAAIAEGAGANCAAAGQKITYGLDNGDGGGTALDGILQAGEVDTTVYVCNGATGATGTNGFNSLVSTSVAAESPGANCAVGGTKITFNSGLDDGLPSGTPRDNILQAGEIEATTIFYSCTGATGATGAAGFNALLSTVTAVEAPGANCATGGTKITFTSGLDNGDGGGTARDGILQAGEIDNTTIFFSCTGATGATGSTGPTGPAGADGFNSILLTVSESPGANCATGGIKITTGLDNGDGGGTARDGVLQAGEIDAGPFYVCNGAIGATGSTGMTGPAGPTGPAGADGFNSLVATAAESAGINCANAGIKVTAGLDNGDGGGISRDGILQSGEIDATAYVCNGTPGANGAPGHHALVSSATESPGANCANGGVRIDSGTDDNDDNSLQAGEIDSTSYACNGAPGAAGTTGPPGTDGRAGVWSFFTLIIILGAVMVSEGAWKRKRWKL